MNFILRWFEKKNENVIPPKIKPEKVINCEWTNCFENEDGKCILQEITIKKNIAEKDGYPNLALMWCSEFGSEIKDEMPALVSASATGKSVIKELLISTKEK